MIHGNLDLGHSSALWILTFKYKMERCGIIYETCKLLCSKMFYNLNRVGSEVRSMFPSGIKIHGGPPPEWSAREHVWELHRPKGPAVSRVTGWDSGSGCEPGVAECKFWQCWAWLDAAAGLCLQLRPITQDGQIPTEVRKLPPHTVHKHTVKKEAMTETCI